MPISAQHVGRTYPASAPYQVSRAKITEFARALGDDSPAYLGNDPIAPPTFAAVIAAQCWKQLFEDAELGLALNRTMHTEQGFRFLRPLRPDDQVSAVLTIEKVRQRGELDLIGISVTLTVDGEDACIATSTLLHNRGTQDD